MYENMMQDMQNLELSHKNINQIKKSELIPIASIEGNVIDLDY